MDRRQGPTSGVFRRHAAPAVVLVTGLLSAAAGSLYVSRVVAAQQQARFHDEVDSIDEALRVRISAYVAKLRSARGLLEVLGRDPTREELRRFVESFALARYYPGVQGIGWAKALRPEQVAAHEAAMRAAGFPGYRVWPPGDRELYSSIVHLEPLDWRNERAIGFDMFQEPTRRAAMERTRDTGEVAASGRVDLVQEAGEERQAGFLVYLAVYERPPTSLEERRALLRGWVYAPFRAGDLLRGTLGGEQAAGTALAIYDGAGDDPEALLYGLGAPGSATLVELRRVDVGGRAWTVRYAATRAHASPTERALPAVVLATGIVIAVLLFAIVRADAGARQRAERAAARASFLADAGKALSASTEHDRTLPDVAALAAERVADGCLVHLEHGGEPLWIAGHRDAALARHVGEALRGAPLDRDDPLGLAAAIARGEPQCRAIPRPPAADGTVLVAAAREMGATASLAAPLAARGESLGAVALLSARPFSADDVVLAADLARLISAAIDTGRLFRRAQEAVAARDEFLAIASHELKTPLTTLALHADGLLASGRRGADGALVRKADVIRRNVERLARLVASLLDISRIGSGRIHLELEEVDLAAVAREVSERFQVEARRAGSTLRLHADGPVVGLWDRMRLEQVVSNLVANALKYGPGKPVDVVVEGAGPAARLTVRDRGIGISEADQARIFERFERAVSRRNYGGFGLGLWIVRQIVEALGGSVTVESRPGEGSTFRVELSRAAADEVRPDAGP